MLIPRQDLGDADHKDFIWWDSFYKNIHVDNHVGYQIAM